MKTLTDYARHIVDRIAEGSDRDTLVRYYAVSDARGVLAAYLANPGSSGALIERLVDMTRIDSFDNVCAATNSLREELVRSLDEAERMIDYRVDCLLHPEAGFECPKE